MSHEVDHVAPHGAKPKIKRTLCPFNTPLYQHVAGGAGSSGTRTLDDHNVEVVVVVVAAGRVAGGYQIRGELTRAPEGAPIV